MFCSQFQDLSRLLPRLTEAELDRIKKEQDEERSAYQKECLDEATASSASLVVSLPNFTGSVGKTGAILGVFSDHGSPSASGLKA